MKETQIRPSSCQSDPVADSRLPYHCSLPARLKCKSKVLVGKHRTRGSTHAHACTCMRACYRARRRPQPSVLVVPARPQQLALPRALITLLFTISFLTKQAPNFLPHTSSPYPNCRSVSTTICSSFCLYLALAPVRHHCPPKRPGSIPLWPAGCTPPAHCPPTMLTEFLKLSRHGLGAQGQRGAGGPLWGWWGCKEEGGLGPPV